MKSEGLLQREKLSEPNEANITKKRKKRRRNRHLVSIHRKKRGRGHPTFTKSFSDVESFKMFEDVSSHFCPVALTEWNQL
jgi:hypothetical protein